MDDIRADVVQKSRVVRNNQASNLGVLLEVILKPSDVANIQVIGGFVQQQDLGLLQHGLSQSQLHLPATGKLSNFEVNTLALEAHVAEHHLNLLGSVVAHIAFCEVVFDQRLPDVFDDGQFVFGALRSMLDKASSELVLGRKAFEFAFSDRTHECRLTSTVAPAEAISVPTVQTQVRLAEQHHTAVSEREVGINDFDFVFELIVNDGQISEPGMICRARPLLHAGSNVPSALLASSKEIAKIGGDAVGQKGPLADHDDLPGHSGDIWLHLAVPSSLLIVADDGGNPKGQFALDLLDGDAFTDGTDVIAIGYSHRLHHDIVCALGQLADGGDRSGVKDTLDAGLKARQKLACLNGVVNELGEILSDDDCLAEDFLGSLGRAEGALEERGEDREDRRGDCLYEGGLAVEGASEQNRWQQQVGNGIPEIMNRLGLGFPAGHVHGLDEGRDVPRQVVVAQQLGQTGGGLDGCLGDLETNIVRTGTKSHAE